MIPMIIRMISRIPIMSNVYTSLGTGVPRPVRTGATLVMQGRAYRCLYA